MFNEVPLFPAQASAYAERVDALFFFLVGVSAFFSVLIAVLLISFAIKYRRRSPDERPPATQSSVTLEVLWSLIPLAITLFAFVWGAQLYFHSSRSPEDVMEVYIVGRQWMWKVQHVGEQSEINQLHVPVGRPVKLTMISQDVIHSFFVPAFRLHQDVLPNRYTTVWFEATRPGKHHWFCSQFCGTNHAQMVGAVIVMPPEEFALWLKQGPDGSMASAGRKLFLKLQCVTCHSADPVARGPVLEGIYGADVMLRDGRRVRADDAYLRESIMYPDAKIVAGFQAVMPSYAGQVTEEEMLQLLAFLKALQPGQTPKRTESAEPPSR